MKKTEKSQRNFVAYEYKEVSANSSQASFLLDGYENFGWEPDDNLPQSSQSRHPGVEKMMTLRLKRDRKIVNKTELTRLQRNFEACVREIQSLENSKTSKATIWALAAGVIGTAFIACSTFAVTADPPKILLCIIFAIPGFLGWILPYFLYKKIEISCCIRSEKSTGL